MQDRLRRVERFGRSRGSSDVPGKRHEATLRWVTTRFSEDIDGRPGTPALIPTLLGARQLGRGTDVEVRPVADAEETLLNRVNVTPWHKRSNGDQRRT